MASSLSKIVTSWYHQHGRGYLGTLAKCSLHILWCLVVSIGIYTTFIGVCLCIRLLRTVYGKRTSPEGQKAIIITGATSGFGLATSKRLYKLGFTVFACYYNEQEPGYAELLDLKLKPFDAETRRKLPFDFQRPNLFLIKMDVRLNESIEKAGQEICKLLDNHNMQLYCLLNNAGTSCDGPFELSTRSSISNMIDTNMTGVIMVTKQFILRIIKNKGRVVNVSSGVYLFPGRALTIYGATKSAVAYFSDALNEDLKPYGASCHTIVPGNFILLSNILYSRIYYLQNSITQLSNEEKTTYAETIDQFSSGLYNLLKLKLKHSKEDRKKIAETYRIQIPDFDKLPEPRGVRILKTLNILDYINLWIVKLSDGGSDARVSLEETRCIQAFEDAIRLINSPRRIYAGNWFYYHISGPIVQYFPSIMTSHLGNLVSVNLGQFR